MLLNMKWQWLDHSYGLLTIRSNSVLKIQQPSRQREKLFHHNQLFKVEKHAYWSELHNFRKWEIMFLTGVVECDLFNEMFYSNKVLTFQSYFCV